MCSNICATDKIHIPDKPELSSAFKKMIRLLLHREPQKRLGSKSGAAELKKCEFLQDVKWDNIRKMTPPYLPDVQDPIDLGEPLHAWWRQRACASHASNQTQCVDPC